MRGIFPCNRGECLSFCVFLKLFWNAVRLTKETHANIKSMRKYSENVNKLLTPALAFLLTGGALCVVYIWFGLFPFGEKTLAWGDMKQQVIPLMLEFKDILAGETGFLMNFQNAGGMSFWGVFFFFLSSPFSFLAAFIEKGDIYFLVNLLVLIKLALSAAAASFFFREEQPGLETGFHLFFCVSYGLCGYGLLYYQNIVWLDILCLFPVLMIGFRRVIYKKKGVLFTLALAAMIGINYYLSYMVLLALILMSALFVKNCVPKEEKGEISGKIGICAVLSLLLTAVVWVPSLLQCLRSARTSQGLIATIQSGGIFTELSTTLPVLLCTAAVVAFPSLFPFFSVNPKRKTLFQLFLLTSLPLILEPANKLWHTGSYQAFPARYGYIPLFLALWCMADFLGDTQMVSRNGLGRSGGNWILALAAVLLSVIGALILGLKFNSIISYTSTLWFDNTSFLFLSLFALLAAFTVWLGVFLWHKKKAGHTLLSWMLLITCLVQGIFHASVLIGPTAAVPECGKAILETEGTVPDSGLYRVKQDFKFCDVNLLGAAGFLTLNHYTSLTDEKFLHAIKKLGYSSYWMETSACCGTAFSDILLSNKYSLTKDLKWEKTGSGNLGYILPSGVLPDILPDENRLALQNTLFRQISGNQNTLFQVCDPVKVQGIETEKKEGKTKLRRTADTSMISYKIPVTDREILYFDAFDENTNRLREPINNAFQVTVNGNTVSDSYPNQGCNGILELGRFENETVYVDIQINRNVDCLRSFGVYRLACSKLKSFTSSLKNGDLHMEKSRVLGTVKANVGESLFLTIPYAPGMRIVVNQKAVEPRIVLDCFLEIPLEKGLNEIELSFIPRGVKAGTVLSILGAVTGLLLLILRKRQKGKIAALWNRAAAPLLNAAFYAVLFLVYLAPTILWFGKFL